MQSAGFIRCKHQGASTNGQPEGKLKGRRRKIEGSGNTLKSVVSQEGREVQAHFIWWQKALVGHNALHHRVDGLCSNNHPTNGSKPLLSPASPQYPPLEVSKQWYARKAWNTGRLIPGWQRTVTPKDQRRHWAPLGATKKKKKASTNHLSAQFEPQVFHTCALQGYTWFLGEGESVKHKSVGLFIPNR